MSTRVHVARMPWCDMCTDGTPARYDGKTIMGSWANMCEAHFRMMGVGLGTGFGQELILKGDGNNGDTTHP